MKWSFLFCLVVQVSGLNVPDVISRIPSTAKKIAATSGVVLSTLAGGNRKEISSTYDNDPHQREIQQLAFKTNTNIQASGSEPTTQKRERTSFVREAVKRVGPSVVKIDCEREVHPMMVSHIHTYINT